MMEQVFPAKVDALDDIMSYLEAALEEAGCPMKTTMALCVAIEEVFVNVANYAYGKDGGNVKLAIQSDNASHTVVFELSDRGVPFNPLEKPDPDVTLGADEREIGGLGIFITKKTMDHISYRYENGENILTMTKTLK